MNEQSTKIKFVAPEEAKGLSEKEIQKEFEANLGQLDDTGLRYLGSFINIGVGIMDTLALDSDGRPVIMEYKRPGGDDMGALLQAMDYWVYCTQHFGHLKTIILEKLAELKQETDIDISDEIRIIVVAEAFDERLERAVSALQAETMLLSYRLIKKDGDALLIPHPRVASSTTVYKTEKKPPKKLDDHFRSKERFQPLFDKLLERLRAMNLPVQLNAQPQNYIGIESDKRAYVWLHPKINWIRLDLRLSSNEAQTEEFTPYSEKDDVGYFHLKTESDLTSACSLIEKAYRKAHEQ